MPTKIINIKINKGGILSNLCAKLETDWLRRGAPRATGIYLPPPLSKMPLVKNHTFWELADMERSFSSFRKQGKVFLFHFKSISPTQTLQEITVYEQRCHLVRNPSV